MALLYQLRPRADKSGRSIALQRHLPAQGPYRPAARLLPYALELPARQTFDQPRQFQRQQLSLQLGHGLA